MSILSLREINQSQLDTTPVIDGQLIVCLDTGNAYRDSKSAHVKIGSDLEVVGELPLAPLSNKLYYLRPDKLYAYNGGDWVLLNDSGTEFVGATTTADGKKGAVPAPGKGGQRWLDSTGKWTVPANATQESAGFESPLDKIKLDGIEEGANKYVHPIHDKHNMGLYQIAVDDEGHVSAAQTVTSDDFDAIGVAPKEHTHDLGKMIDTLDTSDTEVTDGETVITGQTVVNDDETTTTKYTRKPLATLWAYIKNKASTVFASINHNHKIQNLEEYAARIWDATIAREKGTVLAAPQAADGLASFRKLDKNDVGLGNVDNVKCLPLTGGTMSGGLTFANNTWNLVGDDAYMGDHNIGGAVCFVGANNVTKVALCNKDNQGDYAYFGYAGGNILTNKKIEAHTTGHADQDLGGSWISDRDNVAVFGNSYGQQSGYSYNPVIGQKTSSGA